MKKTILTAIAIPALLSAPASAVTSLQHVFSDSEFNSADWFYEVGVWGGGAGFSTRETSGGNPGAYRLVNLSMTAGEGGVRLHAFKDSAVIDPSAQGAISTVAFSEALRMVGGDVPGMSSGSVLLQGGLRFYRWCWETDSIEWVTRSATPPTTKSATNSATSGGMYNDLSGDFRIAFKFDLMSS